MTVVSEMLRGEKTWSLPNATTVASAARVVYEKIDWKVLNLNSLALIF